MSKRSEEVWMVVFKHPAPFWGFQFSRAEAMHGKPGVPRSWWRRVTVTWDDGKPAKRKRKGGK